MPIQSRYSNEHFESLMHEIFVTLENSRASQDLALMVLGNSAANILNQQSDRKTREALVEKFCLALKKSTQ